MSDLFFLADVLFNNLRVDARLHGLISGFRLNEALAPLRAGRTARAAALDLLTHRLAPSIKKWVGRWYGSNDEGTHAPAAASTAKEDNARTSSSCAVSEARMAEAASVETVTASSPFPTAANDQVVPPDAPPPPPPPPQPPGVVHDDDSVDDAAPLGAGSGDIPEHTLHVSGRFPDDAAGTLRDGPRAYPTFPTLRSGAGVLSGVSLRPGTNAGLDNRQQNLAAALVMSGALELLDGAVGADDVRAFTLWIVLRVQSKVDLAKCNRPRPVDVPWHSWVHYLALKAVVRNDPCTRKCRGVSSTPSGTPHTVTRARSRVQAYSS